MTYRDDREAIHQRLTSLEHENEDLRAQLEAAQQERDALAKERANERERAPKRPTAPPPEPNERARRPRPSARPGAAAVISLALAVAVVAGGVFLSSRFAAARATVSELAVFDGVLTVAIDVIRRNSPSRKKLVTFDLASGEQLAERTVDTSSMSFPRHGTRAWVTIRNDRRELIDFRSLELVLSSDDLGAHFPELAHGFAIDANTDVTQFSDGSIGEHTLRSSSALALTLADGRKLWVDTSPRLHRERPSESVLGPIGYTCHYYEGPSCERRQCFAWAPEPHSSVKRLALSTGGSRASERAEPLHAPAFVKRLDHRCALEVDGGVLVRHEASAISPTRRLVSLLDARDGSVRWTRPVDELAPDGAMPIGALLDGDRIFLLLGDRWGDESINLRDVTTRRLVLAHLAARTGEALATFRLK